MGRIRTLQWTIAKILGLTPEDGQETCHHNFDLAREDVSPILTSRRFVHEYEHLAVA